MRRLAGTWKLVSRVVTLGNGATVTDPGLGGTPLGSLMYDAGGHVAVQIMRRNRAVGIDCGTSGVTTGDNNSQSVNGYDAYFGTYTIDESKHTITHHLQGALAASDVGKDLVREFQLSGDRLTLLVENDSPQGRQFVALKWEKLR